MTSCRDYLKKRIKSDSKCLFFFQLYSFVKIKHRNYALPQFPSAEQQCIKIIATFPSNLEVITAY